MLSRNSENYLVISDLQIPFEAERALEFCLSVAKDYRVDAGNILCVGDEVDQYFGSLYKKSPDIEMTAKGELAGSREKLERWYAAFPKMRLATSNHGQRWAKRAFEADIPSELIRQYQEVLKAPRDWKWAKSWRIDAGKQPFIMMHGTGRGGQFVYRKLAERNGISTVHGHLHASAGIAHVRTLNLNIWGMNVGSLIGDLDQFAFHYEENSDYKPVRSVGVVLNGGTTPIIVPYPWSR